MDVGWDKDRRVHGCLVHIDLIDGKIWIQRDGTEDGIAADLERAGIPKEDIVPRVSSAGTEAIHRLCGGLMNQTDFCHHPGC
jgi:XisI protein